MVHSLTRLIAGFWLVFYQEIGFSVVGIGIIPVIRLNLETIFTFYTLSFFKKVFIDGGVELKLLSRPRIRLFMGPN